MTKKSDNLTNSWTAWKKSNSPEDFGKLMTEANPVIDSAIMSYAPNSAPAVRSKAKILASQAVQSFDPTKGTKLKTHLHVQLQPLRREAGTYTTVHAPERVRMDLHKLKQLQRAYLNDNGREPNDDELADFSGLSLKRIGHIRKFDKNLLGEGVFQESSEAGAGMPKTQEAAFLWEDYVHSELGPQDKLIYDMKTGRGNQQVLGTSEIARKMRISAGAVSQRLAKIADRIAEGKQLEQTYGKQI